MEIVETETLTEIFKQDFFRLWNEEYPESLSYSEIEEFEIYLKNLQDKRYFLLTENGQLKSVAVQFVREEQNWFLIIVGKENQKQGIGKQMLDRLKSGNDSLIGWVIDKEGYKNRLGEDYNSPLNFYLKSEFRVISDTRLESEKISAVRIEWERNASQ